MTVEKYRADNNVSEKTMEKWLGKEWIRGVRTLEDGSIYIPEGAIKPYSKRSTKCKNGVGMYQSIIHGCAQGLDVFPALYDMHPDRFEVFIRRLEEMEFIEELQIEGITYYVALEKCLTCNAMSTNKAKKFIQSSLEALSPAIEAAAKGVAGACFSAA